MDTTAVLAKSAAHMLDVITPKPLTPAQKRALLFIDMFVMTNICMKIHGIQQRVMDALHDRGLVRYCPYAKPPQWKRNK